MPTVIIDDHCLRPVGRAAEPTVVVRRWPRATREVDVVELTQRARIAVAAVAGLAIGITLYIAY